MSKAQAEEKRDPKGLVLAVEDDPTSLAIMTRILENLEYSVLQAQEGREALEIVGQRHADLDIIILDRVMPELDGLDVLAKLKDDPKARHIPVIMATGSKEPEEVMQGIDAGVFYYLTKPYETDVFTSVLNSAMRESMRRKQLKSDLIKHKTSFGLLERADFSLRTYEEAEDLACFLANCYPNPDLILPGLAHLITNAVEHGNLEIDYETKSKLLSDGEWMTEVRRRNDMPEYAERRVHVHITRGDDQVSIRIEDEGKGFDWRQYLEIDPSRALDAHGRGIAQANKVSFDELHYNEKGNVVTAIAKTGSGIEW